jgi:hypothetical protein
MQAVMASPPIPIRSISPGLRAWALQRFAPKIRWWVVGIVGVANLMGGVILLLVHSAMGGTLGSADQQFRSAHQQSMRAVQQAEQNPNLPPEARKRLADAERKIEGQGDSPFASATSWMVPAGIGWILFDIALVAGIVFFYKARGASKGKKLVTLLEYGSEYRARVLANTVDYSIQINGAPRRVVVLDIGGQRLDLSTYDNNYANLFQQDTVINVLCHPSIPDLVFPTAQIPSV